MFKQLYAEILINNTFRFQEDSVDSFINEQNQEKSIVKRHDSIQSEFVIVILL